MTALLDSEFRLPKQVDSTVLASVRDCAQRFAFEHGRGLAAPTQAAGLVAGGAIAAGPAALYEAAYTQRKNRKDSLDAARVAFDTEWADFTLHPESKSPKTKERSWEAIVKYCDDFTFVRATVEPNDSLVPAASLADPPFEWPFAVPLTRETTKTEFEWPLHPSGQPFIYAGRMDAIVTAAGLTIGLDDKTTSQFKAVGTWVAGLSMRAQLIGYNWVLRTLIDPNCDSLVVRQGAIRSTGVEWRESPLIPVSRFLIERWLRTTKDTLETLVRNAARDEWPAVLGDVCVSWSRPCQFLEACRSRDPEAHLGGFTVRRWNPLLATDAE